MFQTRNDIMHDGAALDLLGTKAAAYQRSIKEAEIADLFVANCKEFVRALLAKIVTNMATEHCDPNKIRETIQNSLLDWNTKKRK